MGCSRWRQRSRRKKRHHYLGLGAFHTWPMKWLNSSVCFKRKSNLKEDMDQVSRNSSTSHCSLYWKPLFSARLLLNAVRTRGSTRCATRCNLATILFHSGRRCVGLCLMLKDTTVSEIMVLFLLIYFVQYIEPSFLSLKTRYWLKRSGGWYNIMSR